MSEIVASGLARHRDDRAGVVAQRTFGGLAAGDAGGMVMRITTDNR
ncbi:MAG TPA: hypothetical protein VNW90_31930 [Acetobacteraceae bacterium]|jgi:hypothetical protein|nr:hypothetical protein [Acetobacteraceae bacterium]